MDRARKHTFVASTYAVVRLEELDSIDKLRADLIHDYNPVNSEELFALERVAIARQSLLRLARMESGMYTACLNESLDPDGRPLRTFAPDMLNGIDITVAQNRNFMLAEGLSRINQKSSDWVIFLRLQAQAERLYRRALDDLNRARSLRDILPVETLADTPPPSPVFDFVRPDSTSPEPPSAESSAAPESVAVTPNPSGPPADTPSAAPDPAPECVPPSSPSPARPASSRQKPTPARRSRTASAPAPPSRSTRPP